MEGPKSPHHSEYGVILRAAKQIIETIEDLRKEMIEVSVTATYLEIYQENLRDLLVEKPDRDLKIRMDPLSNSGKELYVDGLSEINLKNENDFKELLESGMKRRQVGETNMNEISSRSHAVLTLVIKQLQKVTTSSVSELGATKTSKIHLIDLAGF